MIYASDWRSTNLENDLTHREHLCRQLKLDERSSLGKKNPVIYKQIFVIAG
jgi:hypothetical protein